MLSPMEIVGRHGLKLNDYVSTSRASYAERNDLTLSSGTATPKALLRPTLAPLFLIFQTSSS